MEAEAKEIVPQREEYVLQASHADRLRERRGADRWGAAIVGGILFALPIAGGL
jgi:hypothetical protein